MYENICTTEKITIISNETTICPVHSFINESGHAYRAPLLLLLFFGELNANLSKRQTKCLRAAEKL